MKRRGSSRCLLALIGFLATGCKDRQAESLDGLSKAGYSLSVAEFHKAASAGEVAALELCLKAGVRLDLPGENGETALTLAARCGKPAAVEWLIAKGASLTVRNRSGEGVMTASVMGGSAEVLGQFVRAGVALDDKDQLLVLAAKRGHLELCQMLLSKSGIQLDQAFLAAAGAGQVAVADYLLRNGADLFVLSSGDESTALMLAAQGNHRSMIEYLLQNGANRFALDAADRCAWQLAASTGAKESLAVLGAEVSLAERELGLVEGSEAALQEVRMGGEVRTEESLEVGVKPFAMMSRLLGPADAGADMVMKLRLKTVREAMASFLVSRVDEAGAGFLLLATGEAMEVKAGESVGKSGWKLVRSALQPAADAPGALPKWMYPHVVVEHPASGRRRLALVAVPVRSGEVRALLEMEGRKGTFEARVGDKLHLDGPLQSPWEVLWMSPAGVEMAKQPGHRVMIEAHGVRDLALPPKP